MFRRSIKLIRCERTTSISTTSTQCRRRLNAQHCTSISNGAGNGARNGSGSGSAHILSSNGQTSISTSIKNQFSSSLCHFSSSSRNSHRFELQSSMGASTHTSNSHHNIHNYCKKNNYNYNNNNNKNHQRTFQRSKVFVSRHNQSLNVTSNQITEYCKNQGIAHDDLRTTNTHVIIRECPFCNKPTRGKADNMYKVYVQIGGGAYFCHRCGELVDDVFEYDVFEYHFLID